ncbi:MAG: YncE family protein [Thermoleophilia bacterium]
MKSTWKLSLVAIMAGALALVLILGASMGTAAAPDPTLSNDLLAMGDAGNSRVRIIDVDAQAVVNDITGPAVSGNHGTLWDGRYVWTANAGLPGGNMNVVKLDTAMENQAAAFSMYVSTGGGLCGIEFNQNVQGANMWAGRMTTASGLYKGGLYEINPTTGYTGAFVDSGTGTQDRQTCGIGWDTSGSIAYVSLMNAKKVTKMDWPSGTAGAQSTHATALHILDTAKAAGYGYVSAGAANGVGSAVDVFDLSTMAVVGTVALPGYNPHSVEIAHNEGFAYSHSREVAGGQPASIIIYDIGGGTAGGTKTAPVVIGTIPNGGGAGSCGVDVATKSDYCAAPQLSLTKGAASWASYADYTNGHLSVEFTIANGSGANVAAQNLQLHHTGNTNGVDSISNTAIANIPAGGSSSFTVVYLVPSGVSNFKTALHVLANDLCNNTYEYGTGLPA